MRGYLFFFTNLVYFRIVIHIFWMMQLVTNVLSAMRIKLIRWTNEDPVHWGICGSQGFNMLNALHPTTKCNLQLVHIVPPTCITSPNIQWYFFLNQLTTYFEKKMVLSKSVAKIWDDILRCSMSSVIHINAADENSSLKMTCVELCEPISFAEVWDMEIYLHCI